MKKLYKIQYVRQDTGVIVVTYALANNMGRVEEEFADIISVQPKTYEDLEVDNG